MQCSEAELTEDYRRERDQLRAELMEGIVPKEKNGKPSGVLRKFFRGGGKLWLQEVRGEYGSEIVLFLSPTTNGAVCCMGIYILLVQVTLM